MDMDAIERAVGPPCRDFDVKRLDAFGSVVRGTSTDSSDIDLLVGFRSPATRPAKRFFGLLHRLEDALPCKVDLLTLSGIRNPYFRKRVLNETIPLYENGTSRGSRGRLAPTGRSRNGAVAPRRTQACVVPSTRLPAEVLVDILHRSDHPPAGNERCRTQPAPDPRRREPIAAACHRGPAGRPRRPPRPASGRSARHWGKNRRQNMKP